MSEGTPEAVEVQFTLAIGKGRLQASAVVPGGQTNLTQLLPVLQQLSSNIVDATVETVRSEGYEISCRAGCGACCRQLVPISLFEAGMLAQWIQGLPEEQQAVIGRRFNAALVALRNGGFIDRLDPEKAPAAGSPEEHQLALDYFYQGVPCPFLQEESCAIHPIRPTICREYLVTSPAQYCAAPSTETVMPIPMPAKISTALVRMGKSLSKQGTGWIPLVFLLAWAKMGSDPGAEFQETGPELLRSVLMQLVTVAPPEADVQSAN